MECKDCGGMLGLRSECIAVPDAHHVIRRQSGKAGPGEEFAPVRASSLPGHEVEAPDAV